MKYFKQNIPEKDRERQNKRKNEQKREFEERKKEKKEKYKKWKNLDGFEKRCYNHIHKVRWKRKNTSKVNRELTVGES